MVDPREVARHVLLGEWAFRRGQPVSGFCGETTTDEGKRPGPSTVAALMLAVPVMPSHVRRVRLPQFQILKPVVCPLAVQVVDDFLARERSPEVTRHHHPVLTDSALRADHFGPRPIVGGEDEDITALRDGAPALPPRGVGACNAFAGDLGRKAGRDGPERLVGGAHERVSAISGTGAAGTALGPLELAPAVVAGDGGPTSERCPTIELPVARLGAETALGAKEGRVVANLAGTGYGHAVDYSKPIPLFVELCAGLASVSLMLQGGRYARPPVSRMGNKFGYGVALHRVMGLRPGQGAERFLWCEPDPGCRALLHAYTDREVMQEAARIIRSWKDEEPRALWERLRAEGPIRVGEAREVARATTIQRWMYGNAPVHNDGDGWRNGSDDGGVTFGANNFGTTATTANGMDRAPTLPATVTPDARAVDPREVARHCFTHQGSYQYRGPDAGIGRPEGREEGGGFGAVAPLVDMLPRTLEPVPTLPATVTPDARAIEPADLPPGTVMYADPPYVGTTGYGNDLPREDVVSMARRWSEAGARVYISEAEPLPALVADGWHAVEITSQRIGQKRTFSKQQREWVTCSVPPAWRPAEQAALF